MRRLIRTILLAAAMFCGTAEAGLRARYSVPFGAPQVVVIADNGDFSADLGSGSRLVVTGGEAFLVQERLTGPIVTRLGDLAALPPPAGTEDASAPAADFPDLVERGTVEVNGRSGRAFYLEGIPPDAPAEARQPMLVLSDDPALRPLGPVMIQLLEAETEERIAGTPSARGIPDSLRSLLQRAGPLEFGGWTLRSVEQRPIAAETIALPAPPETAAALRARLQAERREEERGSGPSIVRAAFGAGRLWLLSDDRLSSLGEGENVRRAERPGGNVLDVCAAGDEVLAVTGKTNGGETWAIGRYREGQWASVRTIPRANDGLVALECGPGGPALLTTRRLIDLSGAEARALTLSEPLRAAEVASVVHLTPAAAFLGLNAGEWGGGLRRIDRSSGRVETIERNVTGGLCDGPLNTDCDPVHAIVTFPSRPDCIAAAVGLMHMMAHGRIVRVCGDKVEQLAAPLADVDPEDVPRAADAASGGYGSAAFFGLIASGNGFLAAAHNGLYRIGEDGSAVHRRWPLFREVDGVLVSFALPEAVLVVTDVNRRASMSGATPLLVPR